MIILIIKIFPNISTKLKTLIKKIFKNFDLFFLNNLNQILILDNVR